MTVLPHRLPEERSSVLVEFVFIALVVFVPLVYLVTGFSAVQRGVFASTVAAREAGRALGPAPDLPTGQARPSGRCSWPWRTSTSTPPTSSAVTTKVAGEVDPGRYG